MAHLASEPNGFTISDWIGSDFHQDFDGLIVVDDVLAAHDVAEAVDGVEFAVRVLWSRIRYKAHLKKWDFFRFICQKSSNMVKTKQQS